MRRFTRLNKAEILHFTFQMSILMKQNYLLPDGIMLIKETSPSKKIQKWLERILEQLHLGESFTTILQNETKGFSPFYFSVCRSGENTGSLGLHLKRLYDYLRSRNLYEAKMKKASFYPLFLLIMTFCISLGMIIFLLPMIQGIAESLQVALPLTITHLLAFTFWIRRFYFLVLLGISALVGFIFYLLRKYRYLVHKYLLLLPFIGSFLRKNDLFLFFQELSLLLKDQVPIEEAIPIASESIHNIFLKDQIELSSIPLQNGITISDTLRKFPGKDTFLLSMIKSGEESNQLYENIDFALQMLELELTQKQDRFVSSIEPIMLLFIGSIVLLLVINLYFPIFQMINSIDVLNTI